jgi:type IV pilus assembly protein PilQ
MVPYRAHADGNKVTYRPERSRPNCRAAAVAARASSDSDDSISNIDFRRGEDGQGRVIISLSDPSVPVDMQQQGRQGDDRLYRTQRRKAGVS